VHDLITRFFFDIDEAISDHDGEVHAYVGDEVIITWPLSEDPERNARSLRCFFAVEECGVAKRQIAYFGDTMNVAARLCEHCKAAGEALVASADMLRSATLPNGLSVGRNASLILRGRQTPVAAHALHRRAPA